MIDPFVLLTPVLLLAVIALLRFVGCDVVLGVRTLLGFNPLEGTYPSAISVSLFADGDAIFFTTDGSSPADHATGSTQIFSAPIPVSTTTTISARSGDSGIISATYIIASAIGFVQVNSGTPQAPTLSVMIPFLNPQKAGNLNIVAVGWTDSTSSVASVSDSLGNTYQLAVGPTRTTNHSQSIYFASAIQAGSNALTVTFDQAVPFPDVRVLEYAGVSALDKSAEGSGVGTVSTCGPVITSVDNELIFAANTVAAGTIGADPAFTERIITADGNLAEDRIVSAIGSYPATATLSASGPWVMQMVAFR